MIVSAGSSLAACNGSRTEESLLHHTDSQAITHSPTPSANPPAAPDRSPHTPAPADPARCPIPGTLADKSPATSSRAGSALVLEPLPSCLGFSTSSGDHS